MASSSLASGFVTGFGSAFLQYLFERFASLGYLTWTEMSLIWGVDGELRKLQRSFVKVRDLVDHVNCNPLRFYGGGGSNGGWMLWYEDMRKLTYDAEALLDHVSLHLSIHCAQQQIPSPSDQEQQVRPMILSHITQLDLPHEISKMHNELNNLAKEMEHLVMIENAKFDARIMYGRSSLLHSTASSSSAVGRAMVGRGEERRAVVAALSSKQRENNNFSVISITGMVGVGKTAVASHVFNSAGDFDMRIWVSVSVDFDVFKITKSMIECATLGACSLSDLESLQRLLLGVMSGRKFLLVLDDYWSENCNEWNLLSWPFRSGLRGSRVIVTTRSARVASVVCSSETCELQIVSDDDCWELIKQSSAVNAELSRNVEPVGRQIAKRCKGVPLVATTLGHALRSRSTELEWCFVLKNELWDMLQDSDIFLRLMQSYLHLAPHLQKCFAYCSIFPQNYEFEMEELVFLWIGEGFIQPKGDHTLEDLAKDCFNDLGSRFFFHRSRNASGRTRYKMHELIHGMARLVSKDICFHSKHEKSNSYPLFGNCCHLSLLHESTQSLELKASVRNERLRTFLLMRNGATSATHLDPKLFSHLKFLKVLGLSRAGLSALVDSIDQLIYLRYLNVSDNPISRLPKSMCKLVALQILKLRSCRNLRVLPEEMSSLMSLRHLDMDKGTFNRMPPQFGRLTCLQHLSVYVVSLRTGCGVAELKSLVGLRGSLCITGLDVSTASEAKEAELSLKPFLDKLELEWTPSGQHNHMEQAEVLANLQPHKNLKEFAIQNYCGKTFPAWLGDSSHCFTSIHLLGLKYCVSLPSLGELPFLTSFAISDMPCLEFVDSTFYGTKKFPSLKSFELRDLSNLKEWSGANVSDNPMPCLVKFALHDCPLLSSLPQNLQSLRHNLNVHVSGCGSLEP